MSPLLLPEEGWKQGVELCGAGWSWVEVELCGAVWSWMELCGGGWRWVEVGGALTVARQVIGLHSCLCLLCRFMSSDLAARLCRDVNKMLGNLITS